MAEELGPFHIEKDEKTLYLNPYAWNQVRYSLDNIGDTILKLSFVVESAVNELGSSAALLDFFTWNIGTKIQEKIKENEHEKRVDTYVPQLSQAISRYNSAGNEKNNKLEGIHSRMISYESYKQLNLLCDFQSFIHPSGQFDKALDMASEELGEIDPYSILTPPCTATSSLLVSKRRDGA
ncbi:hypothetical protein RHMOL_Rhmol06G0302500 [Rhododendron molle]|uniref:Uncharacterized protein n=1 Tax=Rhododendron molle TaxID=49168 RepID=A0ACC0NI56_RHOML|nr:hypothetical protein RHMOL_Rhmol06G0302500 [Rhododendron molle]